VTQFDKSGYKWGWGADSEEPCEVPVPERLWHGVKVGASDPHPTGRCGPQGVKPEVLDLHAVGGLAVGDRTAAMV
jgi:hypothetical protein